MTLHRSGRGFHESQGMEDGPATGTLIATATSNAAPDDGDIEMANFPTSETRAPATPPTAQTRSPPQPASVSEAPSKRSPRPRIAERVERLECEKEPEQSCERVSEQQGEDTDAGDGLESSSDGDQLVIDEEVRPKRMKQTVPRETSPQKDPSAARANDAGAEQLQVDCAVSNVDGDETRVNNADSDSGTVRQHHLSEQYIHSNPYFAESIFELTSHYNTTPVSEGIPKLSLKKVGNRYAKRVRGRNGKPKPKLREYAQYLGLQPTVQFKCSKCGSAGFESLQLLNEHLVNCTAVAPMLPPPVPANNTTNFKVTRKVFLCSACGTYYENWNLFLHMREVHKRFICLYCLGMFPRAEKLAAHLVHKHNCAPARHADELAFAGAHREPCFLMCCDCQMVFTEQDCVTRHKCIGDDAKASESVAVGGQDVQVTTNQLVIETSATKDGELSVTGTVELHSAVVGGGADATHLRGSDDDDRRADEREDVSNPDDNDDDEEDGGMQVDGGGSVDDEGAATCEERKVPKVRLKFARVYPPGDEQHDNASSRSEDEAAEGAEEAGPERGDGTLLMDADGSQTALSAGGDRPPNASQESSEVDVEGNTSQEERDLDVEEAALFQEECATRDRPHDAPAKSDGCEQLSLAEQELDVREEVASVAVAGSDVAINEIELDQPLDKLDIKLLLQKCLQATVPVCLYCNHARKIAVNGKQLGMHAIAEHRYSSVVKSITAEELIPESFNNRILESLDDLDSVYFALEDAAADGAAGGMLPRHFECFQCRYSSPVHKELYVHNRKLHPKALLLCTMCKTSFYSYSELLCHLCPGVYSSDRDRDVHFRCCMCSSGALPSAFRLLVHLRRQHNACDVCLEACHDQLRLSNHVWKHKLHHLCYRCGIAYRNKPDITKHLFWKHGTESVECRKCLQKKWPHVYHFCQPAASFRCDACDASLSRASKLMVHQRLHRGERPHACPEAGCAERFISKRLLAKHDRQAHRQPEEPALCAGDEAPDAEVVVEQVAAGEERAPADATKEEEEKRRPKVDVYDLPELNLSESDSDSDGEDESTKSTFIFKPENDISSSILMNPDDLILENSQADILKLADELGLGSDASRDAARAGLSPEVDSAVLDIWNNFKTYQEKIAKTAQSEVSKDDDDFLGILTDIPPVLTLEEALRDHDYCPRTMDTLIEQESIPGFQPAAVQRNPSKSADHDYCTGSGSAVSKDAAPAGDAFAAEEAAKETAGAKPARASSDSSSDSDSSSCTCGSNCSCSSGSSSSSSSDSSESDSSSEEGRRRQQARRERRRGRKPKAQPEPPGGTSVADASAHQRAGGDRAHKEEAEPAASPASSANGTPTAPKEAPVRDSDLSTTESDTDEDFYDKEPQKIANKLLAEKREKLMQMAALGTYINGALIDSRPATPSMPGEEASAQAREPKKSKKSKSKRKKRKKSARKEAKLVAGNPMAAYRHHHHQRQQPQVQPHQYAMPTSAPLALAMPKSASAAPQFSSPLNISNHIPPNSAPTPQASILTDNENSGTRASKRRRVPNKFYGYSSDEENEKIVATGAPNVKFRKTDLPSPKPPQVVPPITIKTTPKAAPVVDSISIRVSTKPSEMRVQPLKLPFAKRRRRSATSAKVKRKAPPPPRTTQAHACQHRARDSGAHAARARDRDSGSDSNSSTSDADERPVLPPPLMAPQRPSAPPGALSHAKANAPTSALYCYCRCPYDEVSEMIGCDSDECAIEWFHFECVNIMVPPKGQWFCPDCRKKKQQRREMLQQAQVK